MRDARARRVVRGVQLVVEVHLVDAGRRLVPPGAVGHAGHLVGRVPGADRVAGREDRRDRHAGVERHQERPLGREEPGARSARGGPRQEQEDDRDRADGGRDGSRTTHGAPSLARSGIGR